MSTRQELLKRLRSIAAERALPATVRTGSHPVEVEVALSDCDRYSVLVDELRASGSFRDLGAAAEALTRGVQELDEQLVLLELEADEGLAVLRSAEPVREPDAVEYWEARLHPGELSLVRYRKEHTAADRERQSVPMVHRSLARLADELADALRDVK